MVKGTKKKKNPGRKTSKPGKFLKEKIRHHKLTHHVHNQMPMKIEFNTSSRIKPRNNKQTKRNEYPPAPPLSIRPNK